MNLGHQFPKPWTNSGTAPADLLMVTTVRMARFFAMIGSPAIGPTARPPSPEELAAFPNHVAAFGHWIASADENAAAGLTVGA